MHRALGIVCTSLLVPTAALQAQESPPCGEAQATLLSDGATRQQVVSAMAKIVHCGDIAPGTIVAALRRATPNTTRDTIAHAGAWSLFDRRLLDSVRVLALDYSQPTARRIAHLQLLTRYAVPSVAVDTSSIHHDHPSVLVSMTDGGGWQGTRPLGLEDRKWARASIQAMAHRDPDARLRKLAGLVAEQLGFHFQQ
jgi:hypothetical protein